MDMICSDFDTLEIAFYECFPTHNSWMRTGGQIAGIVIGTVVGAILAAVLAVVSVRRIRRRKREGAVFSLTSKNSAFQK